MYTAIRLYFTHDLTCQLNPFLNDFLSDSVEIIPGAYTKTKKNENIGFRDTFKRMLIFSLVYIYADVVNGIFGITSRGGDGKKGQDGGNGAAGRDSGHRVGMLFMFLNFLYKTFSLTWSATLQIHWNEKRFLHKKRFNSHRISLGHQHGLCFVVQLGRQNWFAHFLLNANGMLQFHCFIQQCGRRDVKSKRPYMPLWKKDLKVIAHVRSCSICWNSKLTPRL